MDQYLLRFNLPEGQRLYPNVLREDLARTNLLPPSFFSYDAETGHPLCEASRSAEKSPTREQQRNHAAIPGIRFIGGRQWVGILATGSDNKALLDQSVVAALESVTRRCNRPVPVNMEHHTLSIESLEYPLAYWVREMVIKKGAARGMSDEAHKALVKRRLEASLEKQALAYGLDLAPAEHLDIQIRELIRPRGLQIVTTTGPTRQYAQLVDVSFYANAKLGGHWFAGNLTARGYGRIGFGDFRRPQTGAHQ